MSYSSMLELLQLGWATATLQQRSAATGLPACLHPSDSPRQALIDTPSGEA